MADTATDSQTELGSSDKEVIEELKRAYESMREQLELVIVGQNEVIEQLLISIFCRSHALLVGVPGLAKTLLVSTLSEVLDLEFKRIQFTPDLMPADITGTEVLEEDMSTGKRIFKFVRGPIFANMILADEINRTPPKTQAALLEAMQEHHVTIGEETYPLPSLFSCSRRRTRLNRREPIHCLRPSSTDSCSTSGSITRRRRKRKPSSNASRGHTKPTSKLSSAEKLFCDCRKSCAVFRSQITSSLTHRKSRAPLARNQKNAPDFVREMVAWGAGPRAGIYLILAAKARAILQGRYHTTTADVRAVALPVLRHRILTTFNAEAAGVSSDDIVNRLVETFQPSADLDI